MSESSPFLEACAAWKASELQQSSFGFVKLGIKEGQPVQVRFLDAAPVKRKIHYGSINRTPVVCPEDNCLFCNRGDKVVDRFFINVVDRVDDKVKVLEFSSALRDELCNMVKEISASSQGDPKLLDPRNYDIVITKTGQGRETRWGAGQVTRECDLTSYSPYELEKFLVPMSPGEMVKKQEARPAPIETEKPVGDFSAEPPSVVPNLPETADNPLDAGGLDL